MIENTSGGTVITGEHIILARLVALKHALRLEIKGMKRRGRSVYAIIKDEFGLRGSRARVLAQFEQLIEDKVAALRKGGE